MKRQYLVRQCAPKNVTRARSFSSLARAKAYAEEVYVTRLQGIGDYGVHVNILEPCGDCGRMRGYHRLDCLGWHDRPSGCICTEKDYAFHDECESCATGYAEGVRT